MARTLIERVRTLTTLHPLEAARKLQLLRQASMHLREIADHRVTGPALALLGKKSPPGHLNISRPLVGLGSTIAPTYHSGYHLTTY